ncbi:hypothetical protein SDC9_181397 [bioreactor metagenome]|uniref:Uncharacterized protein n=1 Tax=bioreactor metagenome TaxID=1076179 RepID=A0A645H4F6_9ZZZZ
MPVVSVVKYPAIMIKVLAAKYPNIVAIQAAFASFEYLVISACAEAPAANDPTTITMPALNVTLP